jgi:M6 family metalloprotease-like protein
MIKHTFLGIIVIFFILLNCLSSAPLRNIPQTLIQPNGDTLRCFASGDEYYNWLHDKDNYTIIQDPVTGYYTYALQQDDVLIPSKYIADKVEPDRVGLLQGVNISPERMLQKRNAILGMAPYNVAAPRTGAINNLVVFIRFSDESEFTDLISQYDNMFNTSSPGANSMYRYFNEVSYNQLSVTSTFYPIPPGTTVVSYQSLNPRSYFQPYNSISNPNGYQGGDNGTERTDREHTLLHAAIDFVSTQVPTGLNLDGDNDGRVDNVCFIVLGSPTGWASLLWPHKWSLYTQTANINGKRVYTYNFQLQTSLQSSGVGVLCHEMFHSIGSPDLYHYSYDGLQPVYQWDIMENDLNPPQHMGAYMKYRYGEWIASIPEISVTGTYTLNPLTSSTNNCYKVASPNSTTEYYVLEYRKREGTFETSLPGEGLLVYRINTSQDGLGNRNGPPDEVYIYRPNGTTISNGTPVSAPFSSNVGRTAINDHTNPTGFLSSGSLGGLDLLNVGSAGATISFTVRMREALFSMQTTSLVYGRLPVGSSKIDSVTVSNPGTIALNISSVTSDNSCFTTIPSSYSIAASDSHKFYITFHPTTSGIKTSNIVFTHNAAGSPDTVLVSGISFRNLSVISGWNMVSVPFTDNDMYMKSLFPTSTSDAFAYQGGYAKHDTLAPGLGYWLKFSANQVVPMSGVPIDKDTIDVLPNWNLIGSIDDPLPVANIVPLSTTIQSRFFGYDRGYHFSDTIKPGKGYFVKVDAPGKLILSLGGGSAVPLNSAPIAKSMEAFNTLMIEDALGNKQTLYFGKKQDGVVSFAQDDLPPVPPRGIFDVRFASQRLLELFFSSTENPNENTINITSAVYPITITWNIIGNGENEYQLLDVYGGKSFKRSLHDGQGSIQIKDQRMTSMILKASSIVIPHEFALYQNYPNPFNPSTVIKYQLPVESRVMLKVYDVLGQEVKTLVDEVQSAGYKSLEWNVTYSTSDAIASGVYIYRIEATSITDPSRLFVQMNKMILIK